MALKIHPFKCATLIRSDNRLFDMEADFFRVGIKCHAAEMNAKAIC